MDSVSRDRPAGVRERRFDSADALVNTLALEIGEALDAGLRERGSASLVVSGGSTPVPLFRRLRTLDLDWPRVGITLADERWVPVDSPQSNEGLARRELLQERAAAARFAGLKTSSPTPQRGAAESWLRVAALSRPFDVVVLGMGEDGHTASLFPGSPGIALALDPNAPPKCVAMSAPVTPNARLSLNLAALVHARRVILHLAGERKWQIYSDAARVAAAPAGDAAWTTAPPIAHVLRVRTVGVQVWGSP